MTHKRIHQIEIAKMPEEAQVILAKTYSIKDVEKVVESLWWLGLSSYQMPIRVKGDFKTKKHTTMFGDVTLIGEHYAD